MVDIIILKLLIEIKKKSNKKPNKKSSKKFKLVENNISN